MSTRFRIGFPYAASNPEQVRATVVALWPSHYRGFRNILYRGRLCTLPTGCRGPEILSGVHRGVEGLLIESQEEDKSSIVKNNTVIGAGASMQLALVLAVFASYPSEKAWKELPLLLFSGAIDHPAGAPPFIDARIETYATARDVVPALLDKWRAAKMANAFGLVLPQRDAELLAKELDKKIHSLQVLRSTSSKEPYIIGVDPGDLPKIAQMIGISPYHYTKAPLWSSTPMKTSFWGVGLFLILIMAFFSDQLALPKFFLPSSTSLDSKKITTKVTQTNISTSSSGETPPDNLTPPGPPKKKSYEIFYLKQRRNNMAVATLCDTRITFLGGNLLEKPYLANVATFEVWNPYSRKFDIEGGLIARRGETCALLLMDGRLLITGGVVGQYLVVTDMAELHKPDPSNQLQQTPTKNFMTIPRRRHSVCLLPDGKVLISGGYTHIRKEINGIFIDGKFLNNCEIFDPKTNRFSPLPPLPLARAGHLSVLGTDGKAYLIGGWNGSYKVFRSLDEILAFDPLKKTFQKVAKMAKGRNLIAAAPYGRTKVLLFGGNDNRDRMQLRIAELFDLETHKVTPLPPPPHFTHYTATILPNGHVMLLGSSVGHFHQKKRGKQTIFYYDPQGQKYYYDPSLPTFQGFDKGGPILLLLYDGSVLVTNCHEKGGILQVYPPYFKAEKRPQIFNFNGLYPYENRTLHRGQKVAVGGWGFFRGKTTFVLISLSGLGSPETIPIYLQLSPKNLYPAVFEVTLPKDPRILPSGYYYAFVVVNGIPSTGQLVYIQEEPPKK